MRRCGLVRSTNTLYCMYYMWIYPTKGNKVMDDEQLKQEIRLFIGKTVGPTSEDITDYCEVMFDVTLQKAKQAILELSNQGMIRSDGFRYYQAISNSIK